MQKLFFNYYCITVVYKKNLSRLFFIVSCMICYHRNVLGAFVYLCFYFVLTHDLCLSKHDVIWSGRALQANPWNPELHKVKVEVHLAATVPIEKWVVPFHKSG